MLQGSDHFQKHLYVLHYHINSHQISLKSQSNPVSCGKKHKSTLTMACNNRKIQNVQINPNFYFTNMIPKNIYILKANLSSKLRKRQIDSKSISLPFFTCIIYLNQCFSTLSLLCPPPIKPFKNSYAPSIHIMSPLNIKKLRT